MPSASYSQDVFSTTYMILEIRITVSVYCTSTVVLYEKDRVIAKESSRPNM